MDRIWLKSYLPGMATDIDPAVLRSLKQMAESSFQKFPGRSAYIQMGRHLTYGELERKSRDFAALEELEQRARLAHGVGR